MNRPDAKFIPVGREIAKTMDTKCTFTETKFNSSIVFYLSGSTNSVNQLQHNDKLHVYCNLLSICMGKVPLTSGVKY